MTGPLRSNRFLAQSLVNGVKNKMVLRVAAVVNNQKPYVDKIKIAA